ncbi:MAG: tetratricopeptide repeat protein [Alphaproteobacteria bacterium]|nr:tetratricopeptide repeat protein [Alphaproteobacteria bacterium]
MTFLRPWCLLFILLPFVLKLFRERVDAASPWYKVIDEKLLPYLLVRGTNATAKRRTIFKTILWTFLCVAMAGPAWDKMVLPTRLVKPGTVIVLDLSPAMSGENLKKAQQKIYDILDRLPEEQVGLVLYDRFGYTAGPLTFDSDIIRQMVPFLKGEVLPEQRYRPEAGFEQANQLFQNAGIEQGRILFLTGGAFLTDELFQTASQYAHKVGILGIGPAEPHPIPLPEGGFLSGANGKPLMIQWDVKKLTGLGAFRVMTPDDSDVQGLIEETVPEDTSERMLDNGLSFWQDRGVWLVVLALPFFALLFRKRVGCLLFLFFVLPAQAGLWTRPDQDAYQVQLMGYNNYKAERYDRAESLFRQGTGADSLYNLGNALARQEKIDEAIAAYQQVLELNPDHEDARFNKEYLEKQKQEEQQENQENEQEQQEQEEQQEDQEEQQEDQQESEEQQNEEMNEASQEEQSDASETEETEAESSETENTAEEDQEAHSDETLSDDSVESKNETDNLKADDSKVDEETDTSDGLDSTEDQSDSTEEETESKPEEREAPVIFDQESEQILNRLPSTQNDVLRYRIRQQYMKRLRN